jgi:site-specific recombinase XerD
MEAELNEFLKQLRLRVAATTHCRKSAMLRHFYRWLISQKKNLLELKQPDIEEYLRSLAGLRQHRQAACFVIGEFYRYLKHPENPAEKIIFKPERRKRLFVVPGRAAVERMFRRLAERSGPLALRDLLLAELAYGSGLRRAELARLNIEDVDLEERTAIATGKGEKSRIIPLTASTAATMRKYLANRPARGPLLVSHRGKRLALTSVWYVLKKRVGVRPHLLRHACATHMLQNGCGIRVIQQLLGHRDLESTKIYTFLDKKDLREIVNKNHPRNRAKNQ